MSRIRISLVLVLGVFSGAACSSHDDGEPSAGSAGSRVAGSGGSSGRSGTAGQSGTAGRVAAGGGGSIAVAGSGAGTMPAPAMPVRCQTPDCQLDCAQDGTCMLECGDQCNFSTSNRAPIPSLDASCGNGCEGECGRGVQACNVTCTGDCVVECESATCNIQCAGGPATACPDGEAFVCGAGACEEEEDEGEKDEDAGV